MLQLAGVHVRLAGLVPDVVDRVLTVTMATTARCHATAITMLAVITSPVHVTAQLASLENFVKKLALKVDLVKTAKKSANANRATSATQQPDRASAELD